jgi:plasmid stability protein
MTMTVKLDPLLEEQLRQRAASSGRSASDVVRAALHAYFTQADRDTPLSALALGTGLFGRHAGPADLAQTRKQVATEAWAVKHSRRGA